jgi:hypothetical protein
MNIKFLPGMNNVNGHIHRDADIAAKLSHLEWIDSWQNSKFTRDELGVHEVFIPNARMFPHLKNGESMTSNFGTGREWKISGDESGVFKYEQKVNSL